MEELLNRYNLDEKIRPYLVTYPFTPKNIDITIFFDHQPNDANQKMIKLIHLVDDYIYYEIISPDGKFLERIKISYDEAYKIAYGHERPK